MDEAFENINRKQPHDPVKGACCIVVALAGEEGSRERVADQVGAGEGFGGVCGGAVGSSEEGCGRV